MHMAVLSDIKKMELLKLDPNTITVDQISKLFGYTCKSGTFDVTPPYFDTKDTVHLEANEYINEEAIDTTVGSILFNKLMVEGSGITKIIPGGFYDGEINAKMFDKMVGLISVAVREEKISIEPTVVEFLRNWENWGLRLVPIFSPAYTMGLIKPDPTLRKLTDETLAKANLDRVEDMIKVEDELVAAAHKITDGDVGKSVFTSGARGSFENDYKNMSVFIGPVQNPVTGKYDFMSSNYMTGLKKTDLVGAGNLIVNAEYPKAIATARGGYITKQLYAVLQTLTVDEEGTDCHTKAGIRVVLTADNGHWFEDQYIMTTKGPVLLTSELAPKLYGKSVLVRSPMGCTSKKICSICAGHRFYQMGVYTMGLLMVNVSNTLMNKNMKLRHSMKMKVDTVDIDHLII